METRRITREEAEALRGTFVGNDDQFMRRLRIGQHSATVICHHCCVAGRYSGYVHLDEDPVTEAKGANWV